MPRDPKPHHNLTVGRLIALLSRYPQGMVVAVDGYEGGSTTHLTFMEKRLVEVPSTPSWEGEWQSRSEGKAKTLLVIGRGDRPSGAGVRA